MAARRPKPPAAHFLYLHRLAKSVGLVAVLTVIALAGGTAGYHYWGDLAWIDSLLNASMILSGMGPVGDLHTTAGKLFASGYALFSGLFFIASSAILMAPVMHRVLHRFHLETAAEAK
jgi:hypothetical protein